MSKKKGVDPVDGSVNPEVLERQKRSKRSKVILILVIIVLLAALGALGYLLLTMVTGDEGINDNTITQPDTISESDVNDRTAPGTVQIEAIQVPDLAQLFGLSVEEVGGRLGNDYQFKSSTPVTDSPNTAIKQLATFTYTPQVQDDSASPSTLANLPTASVYASLDDAGKVIDIYFICDMRLLSYPEESFDTLLATDKLVVDTLTAAGAPARDLVFAPPTEESISYDNQNSENRKITKQTQIYSGRTTLESNPSAWTLTVTYDYGLTGVSAVSEFRKASKTIKLTLA